MPNSAPILSHPAMLSALANQWRKNDYEPAFNHVSSGRYLSPGELMAFLLAASNDSYRGSAALLTCSLLTGIRPEDLRHAGWSEVDLETGTMIVFAEMHEDLQCYALTKPACIFLDRWWQQQAGGTRFVFEDCGEQIELKMLQDSLAILGRMAGIKNLTFDDLLQSHEYIALVAALANVALDPQPAKANEFSDVANF